MIKNILERINGKSLQRPILPGRTSLSSQLNSILKFTPWIADQNFYDTCFTIFYPMALATAKGENCAYGPTLHFL